MAFWGYPRAIGLTRRLGAAGQHTGRLMRLRPTTVRNTAMYAEHSKQKFLYFEVISPQRGHTLRDPKSPGKKPEVSFNTDSKYDEKGCGE